MNFGAPELLILMVFAIPLVVAIVVAIDAARRPKPAWDAIGQNQTFWIVLPLLLLLACGIGSLVASVVYLVSVRPKLVAAGG